MIDHGLEPQTFCVLGKRDKPTTPIDRVNLNSPLYMAAIDQLRSGRLTVPCTPRTLFVTPQEVSDTSHDRCGSSLWSRAAMLPGRCAGLCRSHVSRRTSLPHHWKEVCQSGYSIFSWQYGACWN